MSHPAGKNVPIPPGVLVHIQTLAETPGAVQALCRKAGLQPYYLYSVSRGKSKGTLNEHSLARIEAAIAGETFRRKPKPGKALTKRPRTAPAIVEIVNGKQNGHSLQNGRESGLRGLLDGLSLGIQVTRQTVLEYLDRPFTHA